MVIPVKWSNFKLCNIIYWIVSVLQFSWFNKVKTDYLESKSESTKWFLSALSDLNVDYIFATHFWHYAPCLSTHLNLLHVLKVMDYPRHPSVASSTLIELTSRLDFFKERRSQLMEQLHNLDLNYETGPAQDLMYKPSTPNWNW